MASCPGTNPNKECRITLSTGQGGQTISKTITPAYQDGPHPMSLSTSMCQWYDSDYWHPMASVGMGRCNNNMVGGSQRYNYGPDLCVEEHYLDRYGCPNDLISDTQMIKAGWSWSTYIQNKPRFTYDSSNGKCWDYTDCYCTGCGMEFKTDTTKGWGFTGYGYYVGHRWYGFSKGDSRTPNN